VETVTAEGREGREDGEGPDDGGEVGGPREGPPAATTNRDLPYTRSEWLGVTYPALLLLGLVALAALGWYMLHDTAPDGSGLEDLEETGTFNLLGHWREDGTPYGTHTWALNLTLDEGDRLTLTYSSHGPPEGIQVRLQHPLHPTDGSNGTGGTKVHASSVGGNATIHLFVSEPGAYQVYFLHPGAYRAPGAGDDPDDHTTAAVSYHLTVHRGRMP
jgi:hypothetical protein